MKRFSIRLGFVLAILSLLVIATAAHAGERPIKGSGSGAINWFTARMNGGGGIRHLGKSSVQFNGREDLLGNNVVYIDQFIFVAPNGDVLAAIAESQTFDPDTGILQATISFKPFSSSGRFDDVVGSANLLIVFEDYTEPFGNPSFDFVLEGVIDY